MADPRRDVDEQRRRLFRRMEWVFVYLPPLLAVLIAVFGGAVLAWAIRVSGTSFVLRWGVASLLLLVLPGIAYAVHSWWTRE